MKNKKIDILTQFGLIVIPIIAIIAAIVYSVISKRSALPSEKKEDNNPFAYDITELKKVDPKLIEYKEAVKILLTSKSPLALSILNKTIFIVDKKGIICATEDPPSSRRRGTMAGQAGRTTEKQPNLIKKAYGPPTAISVSETGDIAVCFNKNILFLDKSGKEIFNLVNFPEKALFTSIAIEGDYIYVADAGRRIVLQFNKKGKLNNQIGAENKAMGIKGFIVPSANFDIISGDDNSIWAVNPGLHQIENFTSDGRLRSSWKASAIGIEGFSGCCNPSHIALLPNGDFVTAEKNIVRVKVYDATGKFKCVVATPQQFAEDAKILDIATDSEGKIYVLDSKTKGVRVFVKKD